MKTILILICPLLVIGCAAVPPKMTETQRQALAAVYDDIDAGRYDLADKDAKQLFRLFPPPKKRIPVHPFDK